MFIRPATETRDTCLHCGASVPQKRALRGSSFCCNGCQRVHEVLSQKGWAETYASLRKQDSETQGSSAPSRPDSKVFPQIGQFGYLDTEESGLTYSTLLPEGRRRMRFFLEGAHCTACIWLTEKVGETQYGVESIHLDLSNKVATATIYPSGSFSSVAEELSSLGYTPYPLKVSEQEADILSAQTAHRSELIRIAITGAAAGNLMLLSVSIYGGLEGPLAKSFEWISGLIFLPVLFYGATPFLRHAWGALRIKEISIDLPIALGTLAASTISYINLIRGSGKIYFDSIAGLVFLLLSTRSALSRMTEKAERNGVTLSSGIPAFVRIKGSPHLTPIEQIQTGDLIEVLPGEIIPVDGRIELGASEISAAWLTGETHRFPQSVGAQVLAGSLNETSTLTLKSFASGRQTQLGKMMSEASERNCSKTEFGQLNHRIGKIFTLLITTSALGVTLLLSRLGAEAALDTAISLVLVACPCTFALATPLIFSRAIAALASNQIFTKRPDALERVSRIESVWFDKTGTLTQGRLRLLEVHSDLQQDEVIRIAASLESNSLHPIARAFREAAEDWDVGSLESPSNSKEITGLGIEGTLNEHHYQIRRSNLPIVERKEDGLIRSEVELFRDGITIASFTFGDEVRSAALETIKTLKNSGILVGILSGDSQATVNTVAKTLGVDPELAKGNLSPQDKKSWLQTQSRPLFVGDGGNDLLALSSSYVSIALRTGIEASLKVADFAVISNTLNSLVTIISVGQKSYRALRVTLLVSFIYNVSAIIAALQGWVTPFFAAVLMPAASALTLASGIIATHHLILKQKRGKGFQT